MRISRRTFAKQMGSAAALLACPNILISKPKQKLGVALVGLGGYSTGRLAPGLQRIAHLGGKSTNYLDVDCTDGWYRLRPFQFYSGVQGYDQAAFMQQIEKEVERPFRRNAAGGLSAGLLTWPTSTASPTASTWKAWASGFTR